MSLTQTRLKDYRLIVSLDQKSSAEGYLYVDDGLSLDIKDKYSLLFFQASYSNGKGILNATSTNNNYPFFKNTVSQIFVSGVDFSVRNVLVNGQSWSSFHYNSSLKTLSIENLNFSLFNIPWSVDWF